jgi:Na+-transporting methylmalonyl-CoA/oxaloacetate decarboxylase gamma subunit
MLCATLSFLVVSLLACTIWQISVNFIFRYCKNSKRSRESKNYDNPIINNENAATKHGMAVLASNAKI